MLSSQKCNVTNYGFAPITTVVWRFTAHLKLRGQNIDLFMGSILF